MATEVQSADLNNGSSSRLEVSIDGLTLSPDPEGEQVAEPDHDTGDQSATDDREEGESSKTTIERKWGFGLLELYRLALKFFKGILYSYLIVKCIIAFIHDLTR